MYKIVVVPGGGIGPKVVVEQFKTLEVIAAACPYIKREYVHIDAICM